MEECVENEEKISKRKHKRQKPGTIEGTEKKEQEEEKQTRKKRVERNLNSLRLAI